MHRIRFFIGLLFLSTGLSAQNDLDKDLGKLERFLESIDQRYVDSVETATIIEKGMRTMLEQLDPHSVYMTAAQYKAASEPLAGTYKGIGIRYQVIDDTLTVIEVLENSPAAKGGMKLADQILAIGTDTLSGVEMKSGNMSKLLKAESNLDQPLHVLRSESQIQIVLERDNVVVSSVPAYFMLDEGLGYIKLNRFSSSSLVDFRKALDKLTKQGAQDLVLDLRGNSGGYLNVAIKIVDEFLEDRKLIVYTEGVNQPRKEKFATSGGRFTKGKVAVLIDENSASASEIVAGAIQDWDRGLIVGRRSYGKGLVQRTVEFEDGSAMRLTISRYYTPTGRSIQRPYADGVKEYRSDLGKRKKSGELYSQDSIKLNEESVFFTPSWRKVYGGGGIVPDVFVPADSSNPNDFLIALNRSKLQYQFALNYVEKNRARLTNDFHSIESFASGFNLSDADLDMYVAKLEKRGVEVDRSSYIDGLPRFKQSMKELIGRFHFGYFDAHYISLAEDPAMLKAISSIQNDTFEDLGLR